LKVLFDEDLPAKLMRSLPRHEIYCFTSALFIRSQFLLQLRICVHSPDHGRARLIQHHEISAAKLLSRIRAVSNVDNAVELRNDLRIDLVGRGKVRQDMVIGLLHEIGQPESFKVTLKDRSQ